MVSRSVSVAHKFDFYIFKGAIAVHTNWFSDFSIPTFLTGLDCTGSEKYVTHCPFRTVPSVCSPSADANVICPGKIKTSRKK